MTGQLTRRIVIRLDDNPRYSGSIHDDAVARQMGYRAALVPGAFLYGHFSRLAVDHWGMAWIAHGSISVQFRRAVYNGDALVLTATPVPSEMGQKLDLDLTDAEGKSVATGWIFLAADPPEPPAAAAFQLAPIPDPRPVIVAGGMRPGMIGGTAQAILTQAEIAESLRAFGEDHPIYRAGRLAHSGCLMRKAMFEVNQSFSLPGPYVLTACEGQHFIPFQAGARFASASLVTGCFERNGRYYFETEETVLADGQIAARFRRVQIYADSRRNA